MVAAIDVIAVLMLLSFLGRVVSGADLWIRRSVGGLRDVGGAVISARAAGRQ